MNNRADKRMATQDDRRAVSSPMRDHDSQRRGYDNAVEGRDRDMTADSSYQFGWIEGKTMLLQWAAEELKEAQC